MPGCRVNFPFEAFIAQLSTVDRDSFSFSNVNNTILLSVRMVRVMSYCLRSGVFSVAGLFKPGIL